MMLALYCSMNDFTLSTDLNPSTFAGASDELDWLAAPDAVAELGIGKAGGVTKSPSTTERLFGVPSWKGKNQLHVQYPISGQLTSAVASIWIRPPILPILTLKTMELCSCRYSNL